MIRSTSRPPTALGAVTSSNVSIQRTGLANCQASSSMTTLRAHLPRPLVTPGVVVGENLVERLCGHQVADLLDEVAVQGERPRHQVRDVAPDDQRRVGVGRHDALQRAAEVVDADPQHVGVERHVDAGHEDERALAAADLTTPLDLLLEGFEAAHRAGDGVL